MALPCMCGIAMRLAGFFTNYIMTKWAPGRQGVLVDEGTCNILVKHGDAHKKSQKFYSLRSNISGARMHFVGDVWCSTTPLDSASKVVRVPAGTFQIEGQQYFLSIAPNPSLSNIASALCIPAWVVKSSEDATMQVASHEIEIELPRSEDIFQMA